MDLIELTRGERISRPGAYRMTMDHYHSQDACVGPSVSSSGLRTIELQSPAMYWAFSDLNPDRFEEKPKDALNFGRAAHTLLLGDEVFEEHFAIRPEEFDSYRMKDAKAWRDAVIADGLTPVTPDDIIKISHMSQSLKETGADKILLGGTPEVSLIWKDATDLWVKSRMDMLLDSDDIVDLKTTGDASHRAVMRDITQRGYHMQAALGAEAKERVLGRETKGVFLVFIAKSPPYQCSIVSLDEEAIHLGRVQNRLALDRMAECMATGVWPHDTDHIPTYTPPDWLRERVYEREGGDATS